MSEDKKKMSTKDKLDMLSKVAGWVIILVVGITHPESYSVVMPILCGAGLLSCTM